MFRFSIRDVLWLTVVVALAVSWWHEHRIHKADSGRLAELESRHAELDRNHAKLLGRIERSGFMWVASRGEWYIVGTPPSLAKQLADDSQKSN